MFSLSLRVWFVETRLDTTTTQPILCGLLFYENCLLSLGNSIDEWDPACQLGYVLHACIVPLFLVVCFELAYEVHKRRSVNFFGIEFDAGRRDSSTRWSWFWRNFVRLISISLFVVNVFVNFDAEFEDPDEDAAHTGFFGLRTGDDASAHVLLALIPSAILAGFALYIGYQLWKYGTDSSMIVHATYFNPWIWMFVGAAGMLLGQFPNGAWYKTTSNGGEALLLICNARMFKEIANDLKSGREMTEFITEVNAGAQAHFEREVKMSKREELQRQTSTYPSPEVRELRRNLELAPGGQAATANVVGDRSLVEVGLAENRI